MVIRSAAVAAPAAILVYGGIVAAASQTLQAIDAPQDQAVKAVKAAEILAASVLVLAATAVSVESGLAVAAAIGLAVFVWETYILV